MEVIEQILVVGVGMHRLNVAKLDTELVFDCLERRHDGVGGTAGRRDDLVAVFDDVVVHAVNNVFHITFTWRRQHHAGHARTVQVLGQAFHITPLTRVVDHHSIVDAVLGVIDGVGIVGVDHLDEVAVGDDGIFFFIDSDGTGEGTMHGITTQQAGTLLQVTLARFTHHNGFQAQTVTGAHLFDQQTGQNTADTAKAVEHHIGGLRHAALVAGRFGQLCAHILFNRQAAIIFFVLYRQLADINAAGAQIELGNFLKHRKSVDNRQLGIFNLLDETVCLQDLDNRLVDQGTAVNGGGDVLFALQAANHGNHGFCDFLAILPASEMVFQFAHGDAPLSLGSGDGNRGMALDARFQRSASGGVWGANDTAKCGVYPPGYSKAADCISAAAVTAWQTRAQRPGTA